MTSLNADAVIASAANEVSRRFRGFAERDDLLQEGYLWTALHKFRMKTYQEDENYKRAEYRLRVDVTSAMDRYARNQKAQALGYDVRDEYAYGVTQVTTLLGHALRDELTKPVDMNESPSVKTDPAEGGNFTTMVLDVKQAWEKAALSEEEREILRLHILNDYSAADIGVLTGQNRQSVAATLRRCLKRLVAELGGSESKGCPYDCECHEGRLRLRPGVHSEISGANQLAS